MSRSEVADRLMLQFEMISSFSQIILFDVNAAHCDREHIEIPRSEIALSRKAAEAKGGRGPERVIEIIAPTQPIRRWNIFHIGQERIVQAPEVRSTLAG